MVTVRGVRVIVPPAVVRTCKVKALGVALLVALMVSVVYPEPETEVVEKV